MFLSDDFLVTSGEDGKLKFFSLNIEEVTAKLTEIVPLKVNDVNVSILKVKKFGNLLGVLTKSNIIVYDFSDRENITQIASLELDSKIVDFCFSKKREDVVYVGMGCSVVGLRLDGEVLGKIGMDEKNRVSCVESDEEDKVIGVGLENGKVEMYEIN